MLSGRQKGLKGNNQNNRWFQTRWAYTLYLLLLFFPLAEIALRITNHEPYHQTNYKIVSSPTNCLNPDSIFGFHLADGSYRITINNGHSYSASHFQGRRNYLNPNENNPVVFMMGCSFTYGMGVNNNETFTSILQRDSNINILNFGVPGYGTVQSILQLEDEIADGNIPNMVILNFSYLHFDRNALTPKYRKELTLGYARSSDLTYQKMHKARFPYLYEEEIKWCPWDNLYSNWWGRETFATVNYVNTIVDQNKLTEVEIINTTKNLFIRLKKLCDDHGIKLKVCFLDKSERNNTLEQLCQSVEVDFRKVGLDHISKSYTNLPYDSHPNSKGHERIARTLKPWLNECKR